MRTAHLAEALAALSVASLLGVACQPPAAGGTPTPTPNASPTPITLVSNLADCSATSAACAQADLSAPDHVIPPLLFGDGLEWTQRGHDVLAPDPGGATSGSFRPEVMSALQGIGFTMMRYPGGTLSDLFHWSQAVGPVASRTPQRTLSVDSAGNPTTEMPYFGPDEFASFASQLGTEILLTVNVGTGTAQEAADWVSHWEAMGVPLHYVEIGNEMYLPGPGNSFATMDPVAYAQSFDAFAAAIHAVDPSLKLGVIGISDTTFWCTPNCTNNPWNQKVLSTITEKADFFSIHDAYAPGTDLDGESVYEAMLSYPDWVKVENDYVEQDIDRWAAPQNMGLPLATTEHASFFLPSPGADGPTILTQVLRNQTLASAVYSALTYQRFLADRRMAIANHINPLSFVWQAPIAMAQPGANYPDAYDPQPVVSAFGLVFQAYRELAGASYVPATVTHSPVISTGAVGLAPAMSNVPLVDSIAAVGGSKAWMTIVNRSLTSDVTTGFVLKGLPAGATTIRVDVLTSSDYQAKNLSGQTAQVAWTTIGTGSVTGATFGTTLTIPKDALLRIRVQ